MYKNKRSDIEFVLKSLLFKILKPVFNSYLVFASWACNIELTSSSFESEDSSAVRTLVEAVSSAFYDFSSVKFIIRT